MSSIEPVRVSRYDEYVRRRIIALKGIGLTNVKIRERLEAEDRTLVSVNGIGEFLKRYRLTGKILDDKSPKCDPEVKLGIQHWNFIDKEMEKNQELSARQLSYKLNDVFNIQVSTTTVKTVRRKLGWKKTRTRYCQMIRAVNKPKRLAWAVRMMRDDETFENVIFSDESKIQMESSTKSRMTKEGFENPVPKPKHPYSVLVWGGISMTGTTTLHIFNGLMDSIIYQDILEKNLLPFVNEKFPDGHRLQQDNDPKHTSKSTKAWMEVNGVNHWPTPPESPDINPIELVWGNMKEHLRRFVKPRNKEELLAGITNYWEALTPAECQKYIGHLRKVIPAIIVRDGAASGY